jgi:hypothetical protein
VLYDADAVLELESLKGRSERKAVFTVIDKLRMLGPDLVPPHVKSLKGEAGLMELRPRQGRSPVRPICRRKPISRLPSPPLAGGRSATRIDSDNSAVIVER